MIDTTWGFAAPSIVCSASVLLLEKTWSSCAVLGLVYIYEGLVKTRAAPLHS